MSSPAISRRDEILVYLGLIAIVLLNAFALRSELTVSRLDLNDNVSHYLYAERMVQQVERGGNPLDFWVPEISFGYPVMRTYQPLAYVIVTAVYFLLGKTASVMTVFVWVRYLSVVLMPVSFFFSSKILRFPSWTAFAVALISPLVSSNGLFGVEYGSYIWAGNGLFPQSIATHFLLFAIAVSFVAVREGRRLVLAGLLLGLTFLAHFVFGYMGGLTVVLMAVVPSESMFSVRVRRVLAIAATAFVVAAFQLASIVQDGKLINHSRWEPQWKWDSFGAGRVLELLFSGEVLDFGRVPVLSLLALFGVLLSLFVWTRRRERVNGPDALLRSSDLPPAPVLFFLVAGAALWILIVFGRPTWDGILLLLGIGGDVQIHRFLTGVHVFLIWLAGVGLAALWSLLTDRLGAGKGLAAIVAITVVALVPLVNERLKLLANNDLWGRQNIDYYDREQADLNAAIDAAAKLGGRVYPGLAATWGGGFKIGYVPIYGYLCKREIPAVAFLYHSMALTGDLMVMFNEANDAQYRLLGIGSVISYGNQLPRFLTPVERHGRFQVLQPPGKGGYFDVVDVHYSVKLDRADFYDINNRWLQSDWVPKREHLGLDLGVSGAVPFEGTYAVTPNAALPQVAWAPMPGDVVSEQHEYEDYQATAQLTRPGYVLFRMTYHPNWHATVDGAPVSTGMVSPGFVAVPVGAGKHTVVMRYEAPVWRLVLAGLGLVLAVAGVITEPVIRRRVSV